jgi:hypothetical protein
VGISPDPSVGNSSVRDLTIQLGSQLLRDEVALARAELFARARQTTSGGLMVATCALFGLTSWLALRSVPPLTLTAESIRRDVEEMKVRTGRRR